MSCERCQIPPALTLTRTSGVLFVLALCVLISSLSQAQQTPQKARQTSSAQWGAPSVNVSHSAGKWIIAGRKNSVTLSESCVEGCCWIRALGNDALDYRRCARQIKRPGVSTTSG